MVNIQTRYDIINALISKYNLQTYLEIGTFRGDCFEQVNCVHKECVDVYKNYKGLNHLCTSDDFFNWNQRKYDIIFIDGNHEEEFVTKDIINSLKCLSDTGFVILHDCSPVHIDHLKYTLTGIYNGTVYKSVIWAKHNISSINVCVVDIDQGCGIITKCKNWCENNIEYTHTLPLTYYNFDEFLKNKKEAINLITTQQFKETFCID